MKKMIRMLKLVIKGALRTIKTELQDKKPPSELMRMIEAAEPIQFKHDNVNLYISPEIGSIYHMEHSTPKIQKLVNCAQEDSLLIMDIGGHSGIFSKLVSIRCPKAKIYCFEPNADLHKIIRLNATPNIELVPSAVGDYTGKTDVYINKGATQSSSILESYAEIFAKGIRPEVRQISITSIDDFCKTNQITGVDVIKVDVQGYELNVIRGCSTIIDTVKVLLLEASFLDCSSVELIFSMRNKFKYAYAINDVTLGADIALTRYPLDKKQVSYISQLW